MFRDMRRKNQLLPQEEAEAILRQGTSGVLSLLGDGGYPYGVPLSYVYHNGKLYFHCAKAGHKLDAIRREGKCSFCVIGQDQVVAEKYTTLFRSVIAFGQVRVLEDDGEKRAALEALGERFNPGQPESLEKEIAATWNSVCVLELEIEHLTGKEAKELMTILGEAALSDDDKLYAKFAEEFEKRYVSQGNETNRSIEETLTIGWELLSILPERELKRIKPEFIAKYLPKKQQ